MHDLIPEAYRHASNSADNYPGIRSAFYAQTEDANIGPEKIHVLQTKHATSHTTFFDKKNGLWRQGVNLAQADPPMPSVHMDNKEINAVAGPETTDQISQAVWDVAHRGGEPYPNVRYSQKTGASINNENIDPWVWETTAEMMGGLDRDGNARKWSLA